MKNRYCNDFEELKIAIENYFPNDEEYINQEKYMEPITIFEKYKMREEFKIFNNLKQLV